MDEFEFAFDDTFQPRIELHRGIHFRLVDLRSKKKLPCMVSLEALHDKAAASGLPEDDVIATFGKFRKEITGAAVDRFAAGETVPIVKTRDLN